MPALGSKVCNIDQFQPKLEPLWEPAKVENPCPEPQAPTYFLGSGSPLVEPPDEALAGAGFLYT